MRVLVGEANYAEFEVLNDYLTGKGFAVQWVQNGADAVAAFRQAQPNLIILDALLPGLTGLKVCQTVRNLPGGEAVKTVLLSKVYRQFRAQYESRKTMGVDAYSEKPVNVAELDKLLNELLAAPLAAAPAAPAAAPSANGGPSAAGAPFGEFARAGRSARAGEEAEPEPATIAAPPSRPAAKAAETKRTLGTTGALSSTPFPRLLFYLHKFRRTGALRVAHETISKVIYLRDGNPVFVTSSLSNESLGRYLAQHSYITDEQYNSSLQKMAATGRQQGDILLEMNALSPHQLFEGLQGQIREKILRVFAWDEGEYEFRSGSFMLGEGMQVKIPALPLILEGVKRFYNLSRLERYFNEYKNQRLRRLKGSLLEKGAMSLAPHEAKLLKFIDGKLTLGKIVAQSPVGLSETFQVLYFLLLTEVLRFVGDPGFAKRGLGDHEEYAAVRRRQHDELRSLQEDRSGYVEDSLHVFRRRVARAFENLERNDYYELLELPRYAAPEQIRQSYHRLAKAYRPYDLHRQADAELQAKSDRLFAAISKAYETLLDPALRRAYDEELASRPAGAAAPPRSPAPPRRPAEPPEQPRHRPEPSRAIEPPIPPSLRAEAPSRTPPRETPAAADYVFDFEEPAAAEPAAPTERAAAAAPRPREVEAEFAADADFIPASQRVQEDMDAPDIEWAPESDLAAEAVDDTAQELVDFAADEEEEKRLAEASSVTASVADLVRSELAFQQGEDALHEKEYDEAKRHFAEAMRLNQKEAEYCAYLGFATFLAAPHDPHAVAEGRDLIEKAVSINPTQDSAYTFLGLVQLHEGARELARRSFERALQYNPDNARAQQELRKLEGA
jgi:CheY-like chemotaxis protein